MMGAAYADVRDFIILHYHAMRRDDSPFWRYVRMMAIPDSLTRKLALLREKGRVFRHDDELFAVPSWVAVLLAQNVVPAGYDPVVGALDADRLADTLRQMRAVNGAPVQTMPLHADWLAGAVTQRSLGR